MELVIKLDEEHIKQIDRIRFLIGGKEDRSLQINVINAIKNGTQLPKGHGNLIDADALWDAYHANDYDFYEALDGVKAIIGADGQEGKE